MVLFGKGKGSSLSYSVASLPAIGAHTGWEGEEGYYEMAQFQVPVKGIAWLQH